MTTMSRRRILQTSAASAAALATGSALTGCGGDDASALFDENGELVSLSVMLTLFGTRAPEPDGPVHKALEDFAGVKLDIEWVPGSNYNERVTTTLASQELPSIIGVGSRDGGFLQAAEAGAFWDLSEKSREYENLTPQSEEIYRSAGCNGAVYGLPRYLDPMRTAVSIRADWLENLGLEPPRTVDDLLEIARAFTYDDPTGTGEETYGLILSSWNPIGKGTPFDSVECWFGAPNVWGEADGELVPSFTTEPFFEANRFLRGMYEEGLVNRDFPTFDGLKWNETFFNGEGGIIVDVGSRAKEILALFKQADPEHYGSYLTTVGNLEGPDGVLRAMPTSGHGGLLAISKTAVQTEGQLDQVLAVMDRLSSEEGQIQILNGTEGVTFELVDGYASPILETEEDQVNNEDVRTFANFNAGINGKRYYDTLPDGDAERALFERLAETAAADLEHAVRDPAAPYISTTQIERGPQLETIITDARNRFIVGDLDETGFRAEVDRWYSEGGQRIVDEINEIHAENP